MKALLNTLHRASSFWKLHCILLVFVFVFVSVFVFDCICINCACRLRRVIRRELLSFVSSRGFLMTRLPPSTSQHSPRIFVFIFISIVIVIIIVLTLITDNIIKGSLNMWREATLRRCEAIFTTKKQTDQPTD